MTYTSAEARQELLETLSAVADAIGVAVAALGAAYEQLDEHSGDRLEEELFRPAQAAYGLGRRTHTGFARRHGLPEQDFEPAGTGLPSTGAQGFIDSAIEAVEAAEHALAELQDSMRPVEVGDAELRAGLSELRELLGMLPGRARALSRTIGR